MDGPGRRSGSRNWDVAAFQGRFVLVLGSVYIYITFSHIYNGTCIHISSYCIVMYIYVCILCILIHLNPTRILQGKGLTQIPVFCTYINTHMYLYIYIHIPISLYIYICIYIHTKTNLYMWIHVHNIFNEKPQPFRLSVCRIICSLQEPGTSYDCVFLRWEVQLQSFNDTNSSDSQRVRSVGVHPKFCEKKTKWEGKCLTFQKRTKGSWMILAMEDSFGLIVFFIGFRFQFKSFFASEATRNDGNTDHWTEPSRASTNKSASTKVCQILFSPKRIVECIHMIC